MTTPEVDVGQVWRRKRNGKHIYIVSPRLGFRGQDLDEWHWEGHDHRGRGFCTGSYIRKECDLVTPRPGNTHDRIPRNLDD